MAVPSDGITINYSWQLPAVGGDIGSWGGILNTVFGESTGDTTTSPALGIDGTINLIQVAIDAAELDIVNISDRVTVLESEIAPSFYARVTMLVDQNVGSGATSTLIWGDEKFDEGGVYDSSVDVKKMTVPTGGEGAWQVRAQLTGPSWKGSDDDARSWVIRIMRFDSGLSSILAEGRTIYANDGYDSNSGNVSVMAEALTEVTEAEILAGVSFEVVVIMTQPDDSSASVINAVDHQTYFEAARVAPKEVAAA